VLSAPKFAPEKIEEVRQQMLDTIRRQNDEPGPIARRELKKIVYGPASAWARTPTPESVRSITRDDLVAFHERYYRPNHLILGVAGDVEADAWMARLEKVLEGWVKGEAPELPAPTTLAPQPGVYLAEKDVNQTTVRMGHLGLPLMHPDYHACLVMNRILGIGTFTSRMGVEIRSNRGLAYSVGSGIFEGRGPGMFLAVAGTKAPSTHEVATLMQEIIKGMHDGVTEAELADSKQTLLNQWVFEFDSSAKVVGTKVEHEFYGYPADTLEEYPRKIAAVTREDVQRAARAHLRPADMAVLLVGDPAKFATPLEKFGKVQKVTLPAIE
jgi:predicted Zn-dependent peptidase